MKRGGRLDELLNLLFMILAIGAAVCYFALSSDNPAYFILGSIAVLLRVAHYTMRFF